MMAAALRILYVDDETALLELGKIFLEESGDFSVATIDSAPAALALLKKEQFDAIVSDYEMPGMDGIRFLVEVRTRFGPVPFILFTGKGRKEEVIQGLNNGADFYLEKGGDIELQFVDLSHKIRQAVSRKRAEAALRESEDKYRTVFENTGTAMVVVEESTIISLANEKFAQLTGLPKDDIEGKKRWTEFVVKEDLERMLAQHRLRRQNQEKALKHYEFRVVTQSGDIRTIYLSIDMIPGTTKSVASLLDITERKRVEETLQSAKKFSENILESMRDGFVLLDQSGVHVNVNPAFCKMTGFTRQELMGVGVPHPYWLPEEHARIHKAFQKTLEKNFENLELTFMRKNGEPFPVIVSPSAITDEQGNVLNYFAMVYDITERKRAEEALRKSEWDLQEAQRVSHVGSWDLNVVTGDLQWSDECYRIYGFRPQEFVPTYEKFRSIVHPEDLGFVQEQVDAALNNDKHYNVDFRFVRLDGVTGWIHCEGEVTRDAEGKPLRFFGTQIDITERKRTEDSLHETNEYLHKLIDFANAPIIVWDPTFTITRFNHAFERLTGRSEQEVIGQPLDVLFPEESRDASLAMIKQTLEGERWESVKIPILAADGTVHTVLWNSANILTDNADLVSTIAQGIDITELERAQEHLKESEERYRNIIETAQEGIWTLDSNFHISFVNEKMAGILGYTQHEMIARSFTEFIPEGELPDAMMQVELRKKGMKDTYERRFLHRNGDILTMLTSSATIHDPNGTFSGSFAMFTDITERKRAEEALRESEERYRILTDTAHDAIYTLNPEGVVTFVNSGCAALIGMPPEKIVGLSLENLYDPEIAQEFRENLDKVISTKRPVRFDAKFWHENQDQITWLDAQLVPQLGPDGSVLQVIGISRSITDRKQAEVLLKRFNIELEWQVRLRTAELEHTNTLLEAAIIKRTLAEEGVRKSLNERELLLREIHHRVKNNLQIILSLISLQSRNIKDQKILDTMGEFQNRIMAMAHVHEMMCRAEDISRIDLSEIVTFMGTSLFKSYKVDRKHIRLNVEIKDLYITIDSAIPISLIINELISNSIKHAFPKGTHGEITIAGHREADMLVLSIRDTGIGIPKDLDWMRNKQSLGHRLVVSLVEQLNGTIELDRTTGAAFNIVVKEKQ